VVEETKKEEPKKNKTTFRKSVAKNLAVVFLCIGMVMFQMFFPYFYYSSSPRNTNPNFQVGVYYVYEHEDITKIYCEVSRIHDIGFQTIRISLICDPSSPDGYANRMTEEFFRGARDFNVDVALVILNHVEIQTIRYYMSRWGGNLTYVQVLNEPELSKSWDVGALFTEEEIFTLFDRVRTVVKEYNPNAQLYTNFEPGFILRPVVPIELSKQLDFVGFDIYLQSFQRLSPNFIQLLQKITNKPVLIAEYGSSTLDDRAQSEYIISGLNLFKSLGLKGCWLVYWNSGDTYYGIRDRLAQTTVRDWIAQNVS
jgi:hypothetical protein